MTTEITEIVTLDATRVDAVRSPANGFPILLMKGIEAPAAIVEALKEETVSTETSTETTGTEASKAEDAENKQPEFVEKSAVDELVKSAIAEALKSSEERVTALEGELAKVKATAIPAAVSYTATNTALTDVRKSQLADAKRFERLAETVSDHDLQNYYKSRADALIAGTGV